MRYLVNRPGVILAIAMSCLPWSCPGITDVPPGGFVWLQGYDLNPASPAFRNEGTVKMECVDDALAIGLDVAGDGLANAPTGLLLFSAGAGGSRSFRGHLSNEGRVLVNYGTVFAGPDTVIDNRSDFLVSRFALAQVLGPGVQYLQTEGQLACGGGFQLRDGLFDWRGGSVDGAPQLVRATWRLADSIVPPATVFMLGEGGAFEGSLRSGFELRVAGSGEFGPASVRLPDGLQLTGQISLTSTNGEADATLVATNGLTIAPEGLLSIETGEGGMRRLDGDLRVLGSLDIDGPFIPSSLVGLTNAGHVTLTDRGGLQLSGPYVQTSGLTEMLGGRLKPYSAAQLLGGTLVGHGTILGSVTNATLAQFTPNDRPLTTTGDWTQTAEATLEFTCQTGGVPSGYPGLAVQGVMRLGGRLRLVIPAGSTAAVGVKYPLVGAGSIQGYFRDVELPTLPAGQYWDLDYDGHVLSATITTALPAARLQLERAPDGAPRLRVFTAPAAALQVEYSSDLKRWQTFTGRLQVGAGAVWISDLPSPPDGRPLFFRANTRP